MKIIKRDCSEVEFDKSKIFDAIMKAMTFGSGIIKPNVAHEIASEIETEAAYIEDLSIYIVESMVFEKLIGKGETLTAKAYEGYRSVREFQREVKNSTDDTIKELLTGESDYWNNENSNKNAMLVTTQRDYIAGIESEDVTRRMYLPPDIVQAHDDGIIHFHDADYFLQKALYNCCLINLEDMLQNGTVISNVMIEKPHSFSTACNVATQIIAQVASSQYGGQTISLAHLAPFVDISRQNIRKEVEKELRDTSLSYLDDDSLRKSIEQITEKRLRKEINRGVQTIQYQVVTLQTTNGQAPFLSLFMYLGEAKDEQTKSDLALIIEEVLKQRIQGVKNEQGVWVTPAFPKLLYVLEEDNMRGEKYWYLTELAAKCSANSGRVLIGFGGVVIPLLVALFIPRRWFVSWYVRTLLLGMSGLAIGISILSLLFEANPQDDMFQVLAFWEYGKPSLLGILVFCLVAVFFLIFNDKPGKRICKYFEI